MSISFISGKPGGGKSLFATRLILDELARSRRLIVTNVALRLGEIAQLAHDEGLEIGDINERVKMISEDELRCFFAIRSHTLPVVFKHKGGKPEEIPDVRQWLDDGAEEGVFDKCKYNGVLGDGGVLYVLDEVHIAFNARRWQQSGAAVMYYVSQHRKLSDDVILITQSVQNVDRQLRSVAQDFIYIRNMAKERHGLFRMPAIFVRRHFLEPATDTSRPIETKTFTLDVKGTAKCYDTAAGVGIAGKSGADMNQKTQGLPWWSYAVAIVVVAYLLFHFIPPMIQSVFSIHPAMAHASKEVQKSSPQRGDIPRPVYVETNHVAVVGWAAFNGKWRIMFSDGSMHTYPENQVSSIGPGVLFIEGKQYAIKSP